MSNLIPINNRLTRRLEEARNCMEEMMKYPGDAHLNRTMTRILGNHLDAVGMTMAQFLQMYFAPKAQVTLKPQFECSCGRRFGTSQALSGHKRTCKKGGDEL
ncbi:hypothetical protein GVN20_05550 [Runella sp. CRIBMP]|uniref:C2H2-type zinc finger protein n=1 Tax=Runella sp. CRIBMP TaxID=2683261 RepID=UPI0014123AA0|nr:C2H2-type zinc finger protein [Runella sp. CRIBMP]NBB18815.1 hypothetical protein [Runella sp. CRIBMP]